MLIRVNNEGDFLNLLKEAVLVNTVRPRPEEEKKILISKMIRCSPEVEGDSQLAMILFAGIASAIYNISPSVIIEYFGMEPDEFKYKVEKFKLNLKDAYSLKSKEGADWAVPSEHHSSRDFDLIKIYYKVALIRNYIHFNAHRYNVLFKNSVNG